MVTRATHLLLPPIGAFTAEIMLLPLTRPRLVHRRGNMADLYRSGYARVQFNGLSVVLTLICQW